MLSWGLLASRISSLESHVVRVIQRFVSPRLQGSSRAEQSHWVSNMQVATSQAVSNGVTASQPVITLFICSNCARAGEPPEQRNRKRPTTPQFNLPFNVYEVIVPCAGRLQPEHVLKALEAGSDFACVVACEEMNCHHIEGSLRCRRRLEYVGRILDEVGVGSNRLILTHLPGSAKEDLGFAQGDLSKHTENINAQLAEKVANLRSELIARVTALPRNPMHQSVLPEMDSPELDNEDESED